MEAKNNLLYKKSHIVWLFVTIVLVLNSCDILTYADTFKEELTITKKYSSIPNDSVVTFPLLTINDSNYYKSFDDVIRLNATYLTHSKHGEKSWYEVNFKIQYDTTCIDIYTHQYCVEDRAKIGKFRGVILYEGNLFLIRTDSNIMNLIKQTNDSLTFNSAYNGVRIFYILEENQNRPEYIYAKYLYVNGDLQKERIEINNFILQNGVFIKNNY